MILRLILDLPEDRRYIKLTRVLGRTLLEHLKVVEQDINDLELVVGELCANVVRHSQSGLGRFGLTIEYYADKAVLTVEDHGKGFAVKDVAPVGTDRADFDGQTRIGGFGLQLVRTLSDKLDFCNADGDGAIVTAEKSLHYQTEEAKMEALSLSESEGGLQLK